MRALLLTDYTLHLNSFIRFSTLGLIPPLAVYIQWDYLNKNADLVTRKSIVKFYSSCRILMSEYTLTYFSTCFQCDWEKTLAKTLMRADSCSLLFPIVATFLWLHILTGFLGLLSVALLSLSKLQISLTQHIRLIFSYFFKLSVCKYYCLEGIVELLVLNLVHL